MRFCRRPRGLTDTSRIRAVAVGSLLLALPLLAQSGCSRGGGGDNDSAGSSTSAPSSSGSVGFVEETAPPAPASASQLTISTYNAGLLPFFVLYADERVAPLAQAISAYDSDVICLQEVWQAADQQAIRSAISSRYPNIVIPPPHQKFSSMAPVCTAADVEPTGSCIVENCLLGGIGVYECLLSTCHDELDQLAAQNPECAEAITALQGESVTDLINLQSSLFTGSSAAGLFAFDGSSGVMLASKLPLEDVQVVDFFELSTVSRRAAVVATVTKDGVRHHVGCTHLQSNLDGLIPYTGKYGSWGGEQREQARTFLEAAESSGGSEPIYLAGDFNCSHASPSHGVIDELDQTCALFRGAGYIDPANESLDCTFCSSNHLNSENSMIAEARDVILDHVFLKNEIYSGARASRVFTDPLAIDGATENLSDHYGVRMALPVP